MLPAPFKIITAYHLELFTILGRFSFEIAERYWISIGLSLKLPGRRVEPSRSPNPASIEPGLSGARPGIGAAVLAESFEGHDRITSGSATRWHRLLVTSGEELWVLLLDADSAVRGQARGLIGEVERAARVGDRFGEAQRRGNGPVSEYLFAAAE
jgi:hypothetical protein